MRIVIVEGPADLGEVWNHPGGKDRPYQILGPRFNFDAVAEDGAKAGGYCSPNEMILKTVPGLTIQSDLWEFVQEFMVIEAQSNLVQGSAEDQRRVMQEVRQLQSRSDPRILRGQIDELVIDILRTPDTHSNPEEYTFGTVGTKLEAPKMTGRTRHPTASSGEPGAVMAGHLQEAERLPVKVEKDGCAEIPVQMEVEEAAKERPSSSKRRESGQGTDPDHESCREKTDSKSVMKGLSRSKIGLFGAALCRDSGSRSSSCAKSKDERGELAEDCAPAAEPMTGRDREESFAAFRGDVLSTEYDPRDHRKWSDKGETWNQERLDACSGFQKLRRNVCNNRYDEADLRQMMSEVGEEVSTGERLPFYCLADDVARNLERYTRGIEGEVKKVEDCYHDIETNISGASGSSMGCEDP